jgi:hypothetical protein
MAFAIWMRFLQYILGIRAGCISPLMIWNGLPFSKNSVFPNEKVFFGDWADAVLIAKKLQRINNAVIERKCVVFLIDKSEQMLINFHFRGIKAHSFCS